MNFKIVIVVLLTAVVVALAKIIGFGSVHSLLFGAGFIALTLVLGWILNYTIKAGDLSKGSDIGEKDWTRTPH